MIFFLFSKIIFDINLSKWFKTPNSFNLKKNKKFQTLSKIILKQMLLDVDKCWQQYMICKLWSYKTILLDEHLKFRLNTVAVASTVEAKIRFNIFLASTRST